MAIHMSLGFLFLGSGSCTFGRSKFQIACLLISLFPTFPNTPWDNRYHLQALRHLYILSVESRLVQAIDVNTGEQVRVNVQIQYSDTTHMNRKSQPHIRQRVQNIRTPALLEQTMVNRIRVIGNLYYPADITGGGRARSKHFVIWVKRRDKESVPGGVLGGNYLVSVNTPLGISNNILCMGDNGGYKDSDPHSIDHTHTSRLIHNLVNLFMGMEDKYTFQDIETALRINYLGNKYIYIYIVYIYIYISIRERCYSSITICRDKEES